MSKASTRKVVLGFALLIGLILLIVGLVFWSFPDVNRQLWKTINPSFKTIDRARAVNPNFTNPAIKPGDIADFYFSSKFRAIDRYYTVRDVEFVPMDQSLGIWKGINTSASKYFSEDGPYETCTIHVKFQISNDPSLEEKRVNGTLKMTVRWAYVHDWGGGFEYYYWAEADDEKPVSVYIYSAEEADQLNAVIDRFDSVCSQTRNFFLIGGFILFGLPVLGFIVKKSWKEHKKLIIASFAIILFLILSYFVICYMDSIGVL